MIIMIKIMIMKILVIMIIIILKIMATIMIIISSRSSSSIAVQFGSVYHFLHSPHVSKCQVIQIAVMKVVVHQEVIQHLIKAISYPK